MNADKKEKRPIRDVFGKCRIRLARGWFIGDGSTDPKNLRPSASICG
jgi:hypothetical protein